MRFAFVVSSFYFHSVLIQNGIYIFFFQEEFFAQLCSAFSISGLQGTMLSNSQLSHVMVGDNCERELGLCHRPI